MSRFFILFIIIPLLAFSSMHKFYVSVTQIEYVSNKESVQIITRIFIDDFEQALRERYDNSITLAVKNESNKVDSFMEQYLNEKLLVKINGKRVSINFIGKEYDVDVAKCYLEIEDVEKIESFEISNRVLFDIFPDQQNIIKTNINKKQKSFILMSKEEKTLLKFN